MEPVTLQFWEIITIVCCCVIGSGCLSWLFYDMNCQLKVWDEIVKNKKQNNND
jgi:hypothetical protein